MATVNLFGDLALDNSVQETNDKLDAVTATAATTAPSGVKGVPALAVRHDDDTPLVANGEYGVLPLDDEGRLKTTHKIAGFTVTTGSINTVGAVLTVDVRRASNIVMHVKNTGSAAIAAGAFAFEASLDSTDGTNGTWFTIQAVRSNANTIETATGTLSIGVGAGLAYSWEASVNAYQFARVRCTTATTALSNAAWIIQRGSYATEPIPAAQASSTQTVSGTVTANIGTGTAYSVVTAASTNAASIKTSAGSVYEVSISNVTATPLYVKLYNKTSAPTVGTDVPVATIPVPATSTTSGFVNVVFGTNGKRFSSGIAIAATGAVAANDTSVAVAGVQVHLTYN